MLDVGIHHHRPKLTQDALRCCRSVYVAAASGQATISTACYLHNLSDRHKEQAQQQLRTVAQVPTDTPALNAYLALDYQGTWLVCIWQGLCRQTSGQQQAPCSGCCAGVQCICALNDCAAGR